MAGCGRCIALTRPAAGKRGKNCSRRYARSMPSRFNHPAEVRMNTTTDPKTPPNRVLYATMGLLLAVLLIGAGGFLWLSGQNGNNPMSIGGPFTLEDGSGKPVTDRDFRGKYMLVYFGYTFCPDVCPTTLNAVADAMDKLGPAAARIQPLFITVDPKRDTPAVVKQYVAAFT